MRQLKKGSQNLPLFHRDLNRKALGNDLRIKEQYMSDLRILLVEDDTMLQNVMLETLEGFGCSVRCSNNGFEAIQLLKMESFDVIISDIKMPRMDGISLLETLRNLDITIPVVMMTGYSEFKDDQIARKGGVVLLEKPFTRDKLKELFDTYLTLLPTGSD